MNKTKTNQLTPCMGRPSIPSFVTGEALEEWNRVCDELDAMGILCTADRGILSLYIDAWSSWQLASEHVRDQGAIVPAPRTRTPMHNIWGAIQTREADEMLRLLIEMGLTPRSRYLLMKAKAAGGDDDHDDDFADLD